MTTSGFDRDVIVRAMKILDLPMDHEFTEDDVKSKWRKVIERVHPDAGGTTFLAEEANNARDLLLRWIRAGRPTLEREEPTGKKHETQNLEIVAGAIVKTAKLIKWVVGAGLSVVFWIAAAIFAVDIYNKNVKSACTVSNATNEYNIFMIKGDPDWGVTVTATVKNAGAAGNVRVSFKLMTSQGEFNRQYDGKFAHLEERRIKADFHEPTIEANDIRSTVSCENI